MDKEKYRNMYLAETAEHLQAMSEILLRLDNEPENHHEIDALFREAHSIKGMAATMEYAETARLAHRLEDDLDKCRKRGSVSSVEIDQLLAGVDLLEALHDDISQGREERRVETYLQTLNPQVPSDVPMSQMVPEKEEGDQIAAEPLLVQIDLAETVPVAAPRLLVLLKKCSDFGTVLKSWPSLEQILNDKVDARLLVQLRPRLTRQEMHAQLARYSDVEEISFPKPPATSGLGERRQKSASVRVSTERLDQLINLTGELITTRYQLQDALKQQHVQGLDDGVGQLSRLVKNLHHQVLQVRMVSLRALFSRLSRIVHDLARSSAKKIELQIDGADIEIDRAIVEELVDPLIHMVRNAVDHGFRDKDQGVISLKAWRDRDQVLVQVADDGSGIDPQTIRRIARERGLLSSAQVKTVRDYDLYQLICQPGFSTADTVTGISGRGVGMDVVKTAIEAIGGLVLIDSTPGEGTSITLKLPLSLAIIRVLLIESAGMSMAIPITRVIQAVEISPAEIHSSGKQLMVHYQDAFIPLLSLRKILKQSKGTKKDSLSLVVTEVLGRRIGLVVDRLIGQQEVFVQRLAPPFDQSPGCAGGTILGNGQVVFLLDLQSLLERRKKEV
ncbi:chemotaxis protein CheA [Pelovirga terrestris]|uniref:Chemotaxis protein CheA n=1 Tax=Pelovirga terrestris TaxID=2771352 RepID=A0A8J6UHW1_9BACT|nr:chemotaxis protein CheA [Pelovirga terrestris]MBD1399900.1 chemotaxis protein CheA [Pelovirga terrestris]